MIYARAKDYPPALVAIDKALALAPGDDYSLETKAKLLRSMGRWDDLEVLVDNAVTNFDVGAWAWRYSGYFKLRAKEYRESALAFAQAVRRDPGNAYQRRKFFEACREAGPDCPPLFPERRASYPVLSCDEAIRKWGEQYPKFVETMARESGYENLDEYFEKGGVHAKVTLQAILFGPAMSVLTDFPSDSAARFVLENRVFECVSGGLFVLPDGHADEAQLKLMNEYIWGLELRRNLVDLAQAALN
ncbi:M48 family metallopeptidase [Ruegeria sp. Ofav3-42]|uniref:tetratricopeptide repeat protein n=1 Tax=Ruegeria sp. Ofav3-42 TaxID=2917759 RepID=UPI001EF4E422|nr:hypothetical protein [Ruegeria sp. Ofav3-42]MCG7522676.1 hypothetical protein [Ruegeria sp. Ofav3-42]